MPAPRIRIEVPSARRKVRSGRGSPRAKPSVLIAWYIIAAPR
jgi:hypothetical protein